MSHTVCLKKEKSNYYLELIESSGSINIFLVRWIFNLRMFMQIQILTSISKEERAQNRDFSHKYLVVKLPLRLETFDDWTKYLPRVLVCILRFQESDMLEPRLKFRLAGWRRVSNRSTFWFLSSPVVISRTTVAFIGFKFHRFRKKKRKKEERSGEILSLSKCKFQREVHEIVPGLCSRGNNSVMARRAIRQTHDYQANVHEAVDIVRRYKTRDLSVNRAQRR